MLDNLYKDIGAKIKNWARWIFIIESISVIISGIGLMANEKFLYGLLCLFAGPVAALVSTWLLYAFGEMVEDISLMRQKYVGDKIMEQQKKDATSTPQPATPPTAEILDAAKQAKIRNAWDHWNEEDSSIGRCEVCEKKNQFLLYVEFEDTNGKHQKNLCYDCFSQRDCKPVN